MTQRRVLASPGRRARQTTAQVAIAAICSVALWSGGGSALASTEQEPVVVGDASAIEAGVEVRGGADGPFVLLEAVEPVAVGDGVRTDFTGFAEIAYLDGSRTRLDIDTEFDVVELIDDAGVSTTRTAMGVGRTWHRVESLGEGEFTVETSQATATVRGTAFVLDCVSVSDCSYIVFEGIIDVTLSDGSVIEVVGPAKVEVVGGVAGPVTSVTLAELLGDPWLVANVNRDIAAGFGDLVTILAVSEAAQTTTDLATTSTTTADASATTTVDSTTTTVDSTTTTIDSTTTTVSSRRRRRSSRRRRRSTDDDDDRADDDDDRADDDDDRADDDDDRADDDDDRADDDDDRADDDDDRADDDDDRADHDDDRADHDDDRADHDDDRADHDDDRADHDDDRADHDDDRADHDDDRADHDDDRADHDDDRADHDHHDLDDDDLAADDGSPG